MLVPRFSTRAVLIVTALCAVLFLMIGLGMRGSLWAEGVAIAALSLLFMAVVHAALFGLCYVIGRPTVRLPRARRPKGNGAGNIANPSQAGDLANSASHADIPPTGNATRLASLLVPLLVVPVLLFSISTPLAAGTGGVVTLPPPAVTPKSGLRVTVDSSWVDNFGYLPLTVTVTSLKPATSDLTITLRFKAVTYGMGTAPVMSVDQDIEFSEGDTTVTATVLVPTLQTWNEIWWDILVDGSFEKELSWARGSAGWFNPINQFSGDTSPRILVVADDNQQVSVSAAVLGSNVYLPQGFSGGFAVNPIPQQPVPQMLSTTTMASMSIAGMGFAAQRKVSDLPTQWLAYSALDYLVLTPPQILQIQSENKEAWTAIERWVRGGGNLWLHDVAAKDRADLDGWDRLDETMPKLDRLVDAAGDGQSGWYVPYTDSNVNASAVFTRESIAKQRAAQLQQSNRFAWRPAGMGAVLISQQSLDQLDGQEWTWLQEPDGQQLSWQVRHGSVPNQPNAEFANLLIPGVGLAPVTEFRILITLFVIVIGPVNYWLLKRSKRLHLLILTVPLAALLVTLALFGYAVVGDGFSAKLRAISFTSLDQRAGEATSWARLSYYAGLAPAGGLEFPKDTAVYPVHSAWSNSNYHGGEVQMTPRAVQWADQQYLTEGWLASRTPTQYLTIAARQSDRKLDITPAEGGIRVANGLGTAIELLILRDQDGRLYEGKSLATDASATLAPVAQESDVAGRLRRLFNDREPAFPEAFQAEANRMRNRYGASSYDYYYGGFGTASTSRMMQRINSFKQPVDSQTGRSLNLEDGTYLAITRRGVDLATGLDDPDEEASFHVVEGRW